MKHINISIILAMVLLMACSNSSANKPAAPGPDSGAIQPASAPPPSSTESIVRSDNPGSAAPGTVPRTETATGMNPPHGQPGHSCEIPVGAPLSSIPGTLPSPPAVSLQTVTPGSTQQGNVPAQTTVAQTAPGMNPPHGQPGHSCEIPVGAPLSSIPVTNPVPKK
jgi:hypothetical protein